MPPRILFVDAFYWEALLHPRDAFHSRVTAFSLGLGTTRLVTTDEVLAEVLNWFAGSGPYWRSKAAALVHALRNNADLKAALKGYEHDAYVPYLWTVFLFILFCNLLIMLY